MAVGSPCASESGDTGNWNTSTAVRLMWMGTVSCCVPASLSETGYIEGRNVTVNIVGPMGKTIDCHQWQPIWFARGWAGIVRTGGAPATLAAKAATTTIPIVLILSTNPSQGRSRC